MKIQVQQADARYKRGHRRPSVPFNLKTQPWQAQPFCIFPVLPGETMRKLSHLSRTVSDPVKNRLMGMHIEYSYFYVKHTDLADSASIIDMHLENAALPGGMKPAADIKYFHGAGVNWLKLCLDRIVEWYFRDEGDVAAHTIDGMPAVKVNQLGWWQSSKLASEAPASENLPGDVETLPPQFSAYATKYDQWLKMVDAGMTEKTFEDYLASFGVRVASDDRQDEEAGKPELLRHVRQWTYPTNTVDPSTGIPSSAVVWLSEHDASKDRFFKEPGFIVGVQVVRPKVHLSAFKGSVTGMMDRAEDWLPAILRDAPFTSVRVLYADQLTPDMGEAVWLDMKDLFLYGEQFRNHTDDVAGAALPSAGMNWEYPVEADAAALFVNAAKKYLWTDGIVTLDVASAVQKDTTP